MSASSTGPNHAGFQDRLNHLFASIRAEDGSEYSNREIARRIGMSDVYVGMLRQGKRTPSVQVARRIERAFGLEQPYLLEDDPVVVRQTDDQLRLLRELREHGVWPFAMRALHVRTREGRDALAAAVEDVIRSELESGKNDHSGPA